MRPVGAPRRGAGRHPRDQRDPPRPRGAWSRTGASAPTSSTGSTSCASRSRRCASGARTSRCWSQHFLRKHARRAPAGSRASRTRRSSSWSAADWPGNVRELENVIESAIALAPGPRLRAADLPRVRRGGARRPRWPRTSRSRSTPTSAARSSARCAEAGATRTAAARLLGIGRSTLYRKLAQARARARQGCGPSPRWGRVSHPPVPSSKWRARPAAPVGRARRCACHHARPALAAARAPGAPGLGPGPHAGARGGHAARGERGRSRAGARARSRAGGRAR